MTRLVLMLLAAYAMSACTTMPQTSGTTLTGEQLWNRLGPDSAAEEVPQPEIHLAQLFERPLSRERCNRHRAGLVHYLNRIPVDLSYRKAAIECAVLVDDLNWQQHAERHFDALIDYAGAGGKGQTAWNPSPVLHVQDVFTLIETQGLTLNWMRYLQYPTARHLLLETSLTNADGLEQRYFFDLLKPLLHLYADNPALDFPSGRRELILTSLEADVFNGDALALTGYLYMDIESGSINLNSAQRALRQAWEAGLAGGGITLAELCIGNPESNCEAAMLDQLIADLTELNIGEAWALDAVYRIAKQNAELSDAEVMDSLQKAGELTASDRMLFYAADVLSDEYGPIEPRIESVRDELLRRAAEQGHDIAHLRLALANAEREDAKSRQAVEYHLNGALANDNPHALMVAALHHGLDSVKGRAYLLHAAEQKLPAAQFYAALDMIFGPTQRSTLEDVTGLLREAAYGGHVDAMRLLAQFAIGDQPEQADWEQAQGWLFSGWVFDDLESAARLAALLSIRPELSEDRDATFMITRSIGEQAGAEASLRVAEILLEVEPFNQDAQNGISLLKRLSSEGLAEASFDLAERFRFGDRVDEDFSQAEHWYARAHEQGHAEALYEHANMVFFSLNEHDRGLSLFEQSSIAGHAMSANALAWILCTGHNGAKTDFVRGQRVIDGLFARLKSPNPYQYSTKAACHARRSEFDQARKFLRTGLEIAAQTELDDEIAITNMRSTLELYETDQPYVWQPGD